MRGQARRPRRAHEDRLCLRRDLHRRAGRPVRHRRRRRQRCQPHHHRPQRRGLRHHPAHRLVRRQSFWAFGWTPVPDLRIYRFRPHPAATTRRPTTGISARCVIRLSYKPDQRIDDDPAARAAELRPKRHEPGRPGTSWCTTRIRAGSKSTTSSPTRARSTSSLRKVRREINAVCVSCWTGPMSGCRRSRRTTSSTSASTSSLTLFVQATAGDARGRVGYRARPPARNSRDPRAGAGARRSAPKTSGGCCSRSR